MSTQIPAYPGGAERLTPRGAFLGPDPTPALRQLSEYARPHALGKLIRSGDSFKVLFSFL